MCMDFPVFQIFKYNWNSGSYRAETIAFNVKRILRDSIKKNFLPSILSRGRNFQEKSLWIKNSYRALATLSHKEFTSDPKFTQFKK